MCDVADILCEISEPEDGGRHAVPLTWYQKARDLGAAHGFFALEFRASAALGQMAIEEGLHQEGADLLRHALAALLKDEAGDAGSENDADRDFRELNVLAHFADALLTINAFDELEDLLPRFREKANPNPVEQTTGHLHFQLTLHYLGARLHEARGEAGETERELHALIDFSRENAGMPDPMKEHLSSLLWKAFKHLTILNEDSAAEGLIAAVGNELATLDPDAKCACDV